MSPNPSAKTVKAGNSPVSPSLVLSVCRNRFTPWIVLIAGLILTAIATIYMKSSVEKIAELEFNFHCKGIQNAISSRLYDHARILRSGAAFFNASETVTRDKWHIYTKLQKIEQRIPGIQGIGFSLLIPSAGLARHIQEIRSEGFPEYNVKPDGVREVYSSIIYLEPFADRNLRAFGYDMFSDPVRRAAMERARDTDSASLSGKVVLVQETGEDVQAGALMYVPVYRKDMPLDSVEQRRAAIYGWVYSPYRMNDLIQGILGGRNPGLKDVHLKVFDGDRPLPQSLLYENTRSQNESISGGMRLPLQIPVDFNGHRWTLQFSQDSHGFFTAEYTKAWLAMAGGAFITLLLFTLIRVLQNTRAAAQLMADKLTLDLREKSQRMASIIHGTNVGTWEWNVQTGETIFNDVWARIIGYESQELAPVSIRTWETMTHPDDLKHSRELLKRHFSGELTYYDCECRMRHKDGYWIWIHDRGQLITRSGDGKPMMMFGTHTDITGRKEVEEARRTSEERFREVLDNSLDASYKRNLKTDTYDYLSPVFTRISGYTPEEMRTFPIENVLDLMHPDDLPEIERVIAESMSSSAGKPYRMEYRFKHKDGRHRWFQDQFTVMRGEDGQPLARIGSVGDITERKRLEAEKSELEEQNRQLQKAESLGRMSGAVAHLFNNQLQIIAGYLEIVIGEMPPADLRSVRLTAALHASKRASEVSGNLLACLGQRQVRIELLDLAETCRGSLPLLKAVMPDDVALETDLPTPGPVISADLKQIQQMLSNLVINAREAIGEGAGTIHLSVRMVSRAEVPLSHRFPLEWIPKDNFYACMEVTDSGCGIEEKDFDKIFDPFFSTKFTGRGLGLSVVLGIARTHNAVIAAKSWINRKSVFSVFFPISMQATPLRIEQVVKAPEIIPGGTVLLVEDEEEVRRMAAIMLDGFGFTVLQAKDGVEAVEVFARHKDEISCLVCDLTMPRMDGWETISAIRAIRHDMPVVLASGYDEESVMEAGHPEMPDFFLSKPYAMKKLGDTVGRAMARKKT